MNVRMNPPAVLPEVFFYGRQRRLAEKDTISVFFLAVLFRWEQEVEKVARPYRKREKNGFVFLKGRIFLFQ